MEKKKIFQSQRELFKLSLNQYVIAARHKKLAEEELTKTINNIAEEAGVPESELGQWAFSKDLQHMEKFGQKRVHVSMRTVKRPKSKKEKVKK